MPVFTLPPYTIHAVLQAHQLGERKEWPLLDYGVEEAWKLTRGKGVRVAVLDTGVQVDHPDLIGQVEAAVDFTGSPWGANDRAGHGTSCATIVAGADTGVGIVGIAPEAKLLCGKVLGDGGTGLSQWVANGIAWATDQMVDVISMSLGSPENDPLIQAEVERAVSKGIFVICAAGNSGRKVTHTDFPARLPETVGVAAVMKGGQIAEFSSRGPEVDIAAPGQDILAGIPTNRWARVSGTSFACPYIAGVTALLVSRHKEIDGGKTPLKTHADLLEHLKRDAKDAGTVGKDDAYGFGIIDVDSVVGYPVDAPATGGGSEKYAAVKAKLVEAIQLLEA